MRDLNELNGIRDLAWQTQVVTGRQDTRGSLLYEGDHDHGCFRILSKADRKPLRIIAAVGAGWDHVSVSRADRCPTWEEMEQVAKLFFLPGETAVQFHVPADEHVNNHPYCLHWWRPLDAALPKPSPVLVGVGARAANESKDG